MKLKPSFFQPDTRNFGGRQIILNNIISHHLSLSRIQNRSLSERNLTKQTKTTKLSTDKYENYSSRQIYKQPNHSISRFISTAESVNPKVKKYKKKKPTIHDLRINNNHQKRNKPLKKQSTPKLTLSDFLNDISLTQTILTHIIQNRIVRDIDIDAYYNKLVHQYPSHEQQIREALVQVISFLDSN